MGILTSSTKHYVLAMTMKRTGNARIHFGTRMPQITRLNDEAEEVRRKHQKSLRRVLALRQLPIDTLTAPPSHHSTTMAPLELAIPSTSTATDAPKPYTIYGVSVRQPLRSYTLQKRYSDFVALHEALTSQTNTPPPASLPPKSWLKSTVSDAAFAEERRAQLEGYIKAVNDASDARWRNTAAFRTFLNLPATSEKKSSSTAGRIGASATITDPSVWLDVHRDLKSQLRDARQAVAKREMATNAQNQHEAAADAKACLVRSQAMMSALEGGLQSMGGTAKPQNGTAGARGEERPVTKLGEGELRRRKDLLASAKKEKDNVEDLLSAQATRQSRLDGASTAEASSADKNSLLDPPRPGVRSGRVLGAAKETDETRTLDNEGVLQLQQLKMKEQDEDVSVLTTQVQRLKEMGVQVNNELEFQNEILGLLDKDADRVHDKVNVAKKRIGKIS